MGRLRSDMRSTPARYTTSMVSHLNLATTVDSSAGAIVAEPLDAKAFAPFGDVIFAVVDRIGPGENCEVRRLAQPFVVVERR